MEEVRFPFQAPALRVQQPLGTFYLAVIPARVLLQVAGSERMSATLNAAAGGYDLHGTQRLVQERRISQIADYINRFDSAFPNAIILAANYDEDLGVDLDEAADLRQLGEGNSHSSDLTTAASWIISESDDGCHRLTIPTARRLAAIIDGQHRLFAFAKADKIRLSMDLPCAVFLDLPKPLQAQLFATINSTQKPVDRSLTFELFGYNVADESENYWTPDKLAVFLTRRLGTEEDSPLQGKIKVVPKKDDSLAELAELSDWKISTAVVVDGILRLYTQNAKRDANRMRAREAHPRNVLSNVPDQSPLRSFFIEGNDAFLYQIVLNYISVCNNVFWERSDSNSFIKKTVGVQAIFDILRKLSPDCVKERNISQSYFERRLAPAGKIDFSLDRFRVSAGAGRSLIRQTIEQAIGV